MNCLRVRGGAGLAPAAGLIRSLSAYSAWLITVLPPRFPVLRPAPPDPTS